MTEQTTLADLVTEAAAAARAYLAADDDTRTVHSRELAEILVDIRELFADPDGRGPDYTGRTYQYREAVTEIFRQVAEDDDVDPAAIKRLKGLARYHVSTAVHNRLAKTPGLLARYGLKDKTYVERKQTGMAQRRALDRATEEATTGALPTQLVHRAHHLLDLVEPGELADLPTETRDGVDSALAGIVESAVRLRAETTTPRQTLEMIDALLEEYGRPEEGRQASGA